MQSGTKKIKTVVELPFEEGKTYKTKFQTGETFLLQKIEWLTIKGQKIKIINFWGIYTKCQHIGTCPINPDRLIPDTVPGEEITVCKNCGSEV